MKFPKGVHRIKERPKFSTHRGRTWDIVRITMPDQTEIEGVMDYTWGHYVYFQDLQLNWYKVPNSWYETLNSSAGCLHINLARDRNTSFRP